MLYFIIQGVIDNHNISKEHKMHFTTESVIENLSLNDTPRSEVHLMSFTNVVIVYDSPYYEIQHKYEKVDSKENNSDIGTKRVPKFIFEYLTHKLVDKSLRTNI